MLKRTLPIILVITLVAAVGLAGAWLWTAQAQTPETESGYNPAQTITVVGRGSAHIEPDIARVSIGVETSSETLAEAVENNETQMETILAALREAGIADKDIQTTNYSIHLDRYPESLPRATEGETAPQPVYRVSNMVTVTIRDLEAVGSVLDSVVEAGANNIWGISFDVDDPAVAQADARAEAMENARERAGALAELSGVELGPVMSVTEVIGSNPVSVAVDMERAAMAGGGNISPGELEIGYQVQVSFFIEP
jgi:hypothetical protein